MSDTEYHAVEGSAAKITDNDDDAEQFNPRLFHRGMTDVQEYLLAINQSAYADWPVDPDADDDPTHVFDPDESAIDVEEDTALDVVTHAIPTGWDASVVVDANDSYDGWYMVVMCLRCGGGVNIWVQTKVTHYHHIDEVSLEMTDITDRTETVSVRKINLRASAGVIARLMRNTTRLAMMAYTQTISSGMKAFDYCMTVGNPSSRKHDAYIVPVNQSYWSDIRDVTRQTISDNKSDARDDLSEAGVDDLFNDPLRTLETEQNPALTYTDSKEEAYVRLV